MTIEINNPELEALIRSRQQSGQSLEDVLWQALTSARTEDQLVPSNGAVPEARKSLAQLFAESLRYTDPTGVYLYADGNKCDSDPDEVLEEMIAMLSLKRGCYHHTPFGRGDQDAVARERGPAWPVHGGGSARHLEMRACPATAQPREPSRCHSRPARPSGGRGTASISTSALARAA